MNSIVRSLSLSGLCLSIALVGCSSSDDETPDSGTAVIIPDLGTPDSGNTPTPDAGFPDVGFRDASMPRDAGHFCAEGNATVEGESVPLGEADDIPVTVDDAQAIVSCIDEDPGRLIDGRITFRACITLVGNSTTATDAELDDLEIDVFPTRDLAGEVVNPTFTASTGADLRPDMRVMAEAARQPNSVQCASGIEYEIGRLSANGVRAAVEYTVRVRSRAGTDTWATSYHHRTMVLPDRIVGGAVGNCTPQDCTGAIELIAVRPSAINEFNAALSAAPAGSDDLFDQVGDGYAIASAADCGELNLKGATAGFAPAPAGAAYLTDGAVDMAATVSTSGLYLGVGFTGTSSTAPATVRAAIGLIRNANTCTESFAGASMPVWPDAVSVYRSSRLTTLHQ